MLPQPRRTSPRIAAGSPQDSGLPAASASSARPHSSGPQRPDLGQPRSQRIRCLLGGSGTSRRSRLGTAELPGVPAPSPSGRTGGPCFRTCPDTGSALRTRHIAAGSGRCRPAQRPGEVSPDPSRPRTPAVRQPATDPPRRSPRRPSPQNPPSCEPPCHCSHPGGRPRKTGLFIGPFFLGGSGDRILIAAVTLRASAVGAGPVAAAGYASRPEPRGPRFALPPARLSGRAACAGSPTRGSLRRQRRLGCHTIQRQLQ